MIPMITATAIVPAQAVADAMAAAAATTASAMTDMPCGDMAASDASLSGDRIADVAASYEMPCDCCDPVSCDLAARLGTACLSELPHLVAVVPATIAAIPWRAPAAPSRLIDTPLRPPIA